MQVPAESTSSIEQNRCSILLVEDDMLVARSLRFALTGLGVQVVCVPDAKVAQAQIATRDFAAAIVDVGLPDMRGDELIREWRSNRRTLPVLLCTGAASNSYADLFKSDSSVAVVEKPFGERLLLAKLNQLGLSIGPA